LADKSHGLARFVAFAQGAEKSVVGRSWRMGIGLAAGAPASPSPQQREQLLLGAPTADADHDFVAVWTKRSAARDAGGSKSGRRRRGWSWRPGGDWLIRGSPLSVVPRPWRPETPDALPYPILRRLSRSRIAVPRLAARRLGTQPLPARDAGQLTGRLQGCAHEGSALKCLLNVLSSMRASHYPMLTHPDETAQLLQLSWRALPGLWPLRTCFGNHVLDGHGSRWNCKRSFVRWHRTLQCGVRTSSPG
jgi:hypothetical protein